MRPALTVALALLTGLTAAPQAVSAAAGEAIYRYGMLPSGQPLRAERAGGVGLEGASAACSNCHQRSGLGMRVGQQFIPPIAGSYLFQPRVLDLDGPGLPQVAGMRADRDPYSDDTLARTIRTGVRADGQPLNYLMPHYDLPDSEMAELIAYLRQLAPRNVPGVSDTALHFATIVTPDADPVKRDAMLGVLHRFFEDRNQLAQDGAPDVSVPRRMMFRSSKRWQLHVWRLTGAPATWEAQLRADLAAQPVFAVVSGIGGRTWAPVHRFCELNALPCLFPNVDLPVVAEDDFYPLYLSKGVLLDAQLIAQELNAGAGGLRARRVVQIYRLADVGREAAAALDSTLSGTGTLVVNRGVATGAPALAAALQGLRRSDALVLWLRPDDLRRLGAQPLPPATVLMSARMSGLEHAALPPAWRPLTHVAYGFDLPDRRQQRLSYVLEWFRARQIPLTAEQVQTDTYLACGILSDAVIYMVDALWRDYLIEQIEDTLEHRTPTGYYPRLALALHQRFASKGGFMVHFATAPGVKLVADSDWITPLQGASRGNGFGAGQSPKGD